MGLLDFFKSDPSSKWPEHRMIELVLNLKTREMGGIKFGDSPELLSKFGKPDNKNPFKSKFFTYGAEGFIVGVEENVVNYFSFALVENPFDNLKPCQFQLVDKEGRHHNINHTTTAIDIEKIIGPPKEKYESNEGEDRMYIYNGYQIDIEYNTEGKIVCFDIVPSN